jgi:putative membrane protein
MREKSFFADEAKRRTTQAIQTVEAQTSAEVVVAVRYRSGSYAVAAYHCGLAALLGVTLYLVVTPRVVSIEAIALDGLLAFVLGALISANVNTMLRAVTRRKTRQAHVDIAARAVFFDLGISRTKGRNGILIFVSTFERTLTVLTDVGIDTQALGIRWAQALAALREAMNRMDFAGFIAGVEALGPVLGAAMARAADDVNELPDEVQ